MLINVIHNLVYQTKMTFYSALLRKNTFKQAVLFNIVDKTLNRKVQKKNYLYMMMQAVWQINSQISLSKKYKL